MDLDFLTEEVKKLARETGEFLKNKVKQILIFWKNVF